MYKRELDEVNVCICECETKKKNKNAKRRRQKAYCNFSGLLYEANVKRALVLAAFQLK